MSLSLVSSSKPSRRSESRRFVRVDCQAVRASDFRRVGGQVLDLSLSGMRVAPESEVDIGEQLLVSFQISGNPDGIGEGPWIDAEATVVHQAEQDGRVELGLSFDELSDESRQILAARLPKIPPVVPRTQSGTYRRLA